MLFNVLHTALIATTLLAGSTQSFPAKQAAKAPLMSHPIGYSENYIHIPASINETAPRLHTPSLDYTNLTALSAWSPASNLERRQDGADFDRPSHFVGKLLWSTGSSNCSASLVGPRHILTARHCAPGGAEEEERDESITVTFALGYYDGESSSFGSATVEEMYMVDLDVVECRTKHDFAVMVLSERLGDKVGWFGAVIPDSSRFNKAIFTTRGYPGAIDGGERPTYQDEIILPDPWVGFDNSQFDCDATGPIYSDSESSPGQSGSALWDEDSNIWGILSASISDVAHPGSAWASGDVMLSTLNQALLDYP